MNHAKTRLSILTLILFTFTSSYANDATETANHRYFHLLSMLENVQNGNLSLHVRREHMANILDQMDPGNPPPIG